MFSSKLRVVVGTVAAVGALSVTGVATATFIQRPGSGTTPQPIKTNPTMPKRVAVGVAFGGLKNQDISNAYEQYLNGDLAQYWGAKAAGDQIAATAAKVATKQTPTTR